MKTDIFEDMKDYIGCNDVSDLPYRKRYRAGDKDRESDGHPVRYV